jgi:hypothetical protein
VQQWRLAFSIRVVLAQKFVDPARRDEPAMMKRKEPKSNQCVMGQEGRG